MPGRGVRKVLQPALYLAVALSVHALLFLVPSGTGTRRGEDSVRGVRIRTIGGPPSISAPQASPAPAPPARPERVERSPFPVDRGGSPGVAGGGGSPAAPGGAGGSSVGTQGGTGERASAGTSPPAGEFGAYLARLRSEGVQGWARDSAGRMRQGWKGSGKGGGAGIGAGTGTGGAGGGVGDGSGGGGGGKGGGYLDPRVRMVVTSYPRTSIEERYTQVRYPDWKVKKANYTAGWWNVYLQIRTDGAGKVTALRVLRPETDGPLERIFVAQVRREVDRWTFDRTAAEINVDVRFHVE
ncbi:MAG: hypothetical protein OHK0028_06240 [Deltaproteobacteria bacterium]